MVHIKIKNLGLKFSLEKTKRSTIKELLISPKKRFDNTFWALRNFNMDLKQGDVVGITGPNGAGKSTLLRTIAGIYSHDEGTIDVKGKVSLLSINAGFEQELSGIENIFIVGTLNGLTESRIRKLVPRIIEFSELGDFIYQPVRMYSSGMAARLGFAIAIHINSDIILIDEVMAVGDKEFKAKCKKVLDDFIISKKKIIIIVSHEVEYLSKLCNKSIEIK
ncbi:ABC transporter ATP-binding protein [Candidatus Woesearchaeota archaeon]|nr:ABC transporter ATP-binding protein [Candidatus Woesearchaeota archaeon]